MGERKGGRRRRRWPVWVGAILGVLIIGILTLPSTFSTKKGSGYLLSMVNGWIKGKVQVQGVSLSWGGPTEVRGVVVSDPVGRTVLEAKTVQWSQGVWGAIRSGMNFKQVKVDSPQAVLYFDQSGSVSIEQAVASRTTQPQTQASTGSPLPQPVGRLTISGGNLRMVRPNGQAFAVSSINGDFNINTLSRVKGNVKVKLAEGSTVSGDFDVRGLVKNDEFVPMKAEGSVKVNTEGGVDLGKLAAFALDNPNAGGMANLKFEAEFKDGTARADFAGRVAGLQAGRTGKEHIKPIDVNLNGRLRATDRDLKAVTSVSGQPGKIEASLEYQYPKQPVDLSADKLMGMILRGEQSPLPEFTVESKGKVDIPTLAEAVPALLTLQSDVEITEGSFEISQLTVHGGAKPGGSGTVELTQVRAKRGDRALKLDPISLSFDARIEEGKGLEIVKADLKAEFVQIRAKGTFTNLDADFSGDLGKIRRFGEVFEPLAIDVKGTVAGKLDLNKAQPDQIDIRLDLNTKEFHYADGGGRLEMEDGKVNYNGFLKMKNHDLERMEVREVKIDIDNSLEGTAGGWYNFQHHGFHTDLNLTQVDVGYVLYGASTLAGENLGRVEGTGKGKFSIEQLSTREPLVFSGTGEVTQLQIGTGPEAFKDSRLDFSAKSVAVIPSEEAIAIKDLSASTPTLSVRAEGQIRKFSTRPTMDLAGQYKASMERITELLHQYVPETAPSIAFTGTSSNPFTLAGPLTNPTFSGFNAKWGVNWGTGRLYGMNLAGALISAAIRNNRLELPTEPIPTEGGILQLGGYIDFSGPAARLLVPGKLKVLNNIAINPQIGQELLSHINPIFGNSMKLDGRATLEITDLNLPLTDAIATAAVGRGHLDLKDVHFQPRGIMSDLFKLGSLGNNNTYAIKMDGLDFTIANGRISYENFRVVFLGGYDMIFFGSVGFDDTVDLYVSLPLKPALVDKIDFRPGFLRPSDILLKGIRIVIPLAGMRNNLRMDLAKASLEKVFQETFKGIFQQPKNEFKSIENLLKPKPSTTQPGGVEEFGKELLDILKE
jgi:hypothetical protein